MAHMQTQNGSEYIRAYKLREEIERLEREVMLLRETPAERKARILAAQAWWDNRDAELAAELAAGFICGYDMPPRPVL